MKDLVIGVNGFSLPLDAVTTTIGVLGIRGSGKSHTASIVAEEMLKAGLQVIMLDPLDSLWGIRSSRDGKSAGYAVTVLGGEHADIPLEASSGPIVADFAVEHGASMVLALRLFSKTDQRRFVAEFCERLYRLKGKADHRTPVHVIIDEADEVAPQRLGRGMERCFGAVDTLVRRGRSSGIGVSLITQRPAAINKDVLTQIELLITHRVISPQDRKAIDAWIEAHPVGEQASKLQTSVARLKAGECWVWSPSWLDVFERIHIRQRRTFDSSATPKVGGQVVAPSGRADVDLDALRAQMASTIEKAEANDPVALRRELAEAKRQLAKAQQGDHSECQARIDELERSFWDVWEKGQNAVDWYRGRLLAITNEIPQDSREWPSFGLTKEKIQEIIDRSVTKTKPSPLPVPAKRTPNSQILNGNNGDPLPKSWRAILTALAQYPQGRNRTQIALLTGYSQGSGSFGQALADLRREDYIEGSKDLFMITQAGLSVLGDFTPLPTGTALIEYWANRLPKCQSSVLQYIASRYPHRQNKEQVANATGYSPGSGSFGQAIADLRTLGLVTTGSEFTLSEEVAL